MYFSSSINTNYLPLHLYLNLLGTLKQLHVSILYFYKHAFTFIF